MDSPHPADAATDDVDAGAVHVPQAELDPAVRAVRRLRDALRHHEREPDALRYVAVRSAFADVERAIADECREAVRLDGMLAIVQRQHPRQRNRVRAVRAGYQRLDALVAAVRDAMDVDATVDGTPVVGTDVGPQIDSLQVALEAVRRRESDLIYEAYYEAFDRELGQAADHP